MYKKRKKDKRILFFVIGLVVVFLSIIILYIMNTKRNLNPVEKVIKDTVLSVGKVIYKPIDFISDKIKENNEKNNLYKKYQELLKDYNNLKNYSEELENLKKDNENLKKQLGIMETLSDYEKINTSVVNRNVGYWYDTITINGGTSRGVGPGDAVINSDGLIGKVVSSSNLYSTVRLLTSENLDQKISVRIKIEDGRYIYGLLSGYDAKNNLYRVEGISENVEIKEGNTVKTTGMSDVFPNGILVGHVDSVVKDNFDLTMVAYIKPSCDFDDLNYLAVLKRKIDVNE